MSETPFTLIDGTRTAQVAARVRGESVALPADVMAGELGWHLREEGLCRGEVCIPVRDRAALVSEDGIDLASLASALGRPLALEASLAAAAMGAAAADRSAALASGEAPDFALADLTGKVHSLSDYRGKKVLLIAYASW